MTYPADFMTELFRAANAVEKLTMSEKGRLLLRAMCTIYDLRDKAGMVPGTVLADAADCIKLN